VSELFKVICCITIAEKKSSEKKRICFNTKQRLLIYHWSVSFKPFFMLCRTILILAHDCLHSQYNSYWHNLPTPSNIATPSTTSSSCPTTQFYYHHRVFSCYFQIFPSVTLSATPVSSCNSCHQSLPTILSSVAHSSCDSTVHNATWCSYKLDSTLSQS